MVIKRKRVRLDVKEDRLSGLPDELIHQILYRFDTRFVVQTCVLSSRWKLIWKSIPRLEFSTQRFKTLPTFANFVTHVLTHRDRQVKVSSVELRFHGVASLVVVKKIADYASSNNVHKLTVISLHRSWPRINHEYPPCLFSSQTLKHLSLTSRFATFIIPKTPWNFPALTTLHLYDTRLANNQNESFDLFSKCLNLENLVIESSHICAKVFDINTPRLSTFKLIDCTGSGFINVIAPLLDNLAVIVDSSIDKHEYPPGLFNSQTLKHLSLEIWFPLEHIPETPWNFPALTSLHLYATTLADNNNESVDLFSKCLNLENLVIERCIIRAKVFDINTPRLSTLKLINCSGSGVINIIAPLLENLTVIIKSSIFTIKAPLRLSYLRYSGYFHPKCFENCFHSLNEASVSLFPDNENKPYEETAARETINMLQELRSARCLTLNKDIVECISSFPELLSHLPSPFSNLISLNITSNLKNEYKVKLSAEARNFLLENSASAKFIMGLPKAQVSIGHNPTRKKYPYHAFFKDFSGGSGLQTS